MTYIKQENEKSDFMKTSKCKFHSNQTKLVTRK